MLSATTSAPAVSFGSSKATSFTVADATRIVAVTPAGEKGRLVDVTVSTASAAGTLPHAYTYWGYDLELVKGASTVTFTLDQLQAMPAVTGR